MTELRGMMEGLGGPVQMDSYNFDGIDPTLDACCEREVSGLLTFLLLQKDHTYKGELTLHLNLILSSPVDSIQ
jgi:hypothetical protein